MQEKYQQFMKKFITENGENHWLSKDFKKVMSRNKELPNWMVKELEKRMKGKKKKEKKKKQEEKESKIKISLKTESNSEKAQAILSTKNTQTCYSPPRYLKKDCINCPFYSECVSYLKENYSREVRERKKPKLS